MIRALVLDFDGLILETEEPVFRAWQEVFTAHGHRLELEQWAACIGTVGAFDPVAELERRLAATVAADSLRESTRRRARALLSGAPVLPGVTDLLERARARGLSVAVASSSTRAWVEPNLRRLGLADQLTTLCCFDDVGRPKPDPDVYIAAVALLGAEPSEAIAFEDSPHGVAAAKAAGLWCVAVPTAMTRVLRFDDADLVIDSLAAMTLDEVLAHIEGKDGSYPGTTTRSANRS